MGFGSAAATGFNTGFRSNSNRSGATPAHDWANVPDVIQAWTSRLQGVVIENKDALKLMPQHDSLETLFYVDPPYVLSTRKLLNPYCGKGYRFEMTDSQHVELSAALHALKGMVVLSGYPFYCVNVARVPKHVGRHNGADFGCNFFLNLPRVHVNGTRVDVNKHGFQTAPQERVPAGGECKAWQNNLPFQIQKFDGKDQSRGPGADRDNVFYAQEFRARFFKFLNILSISNNSGAENIFHAAQE